MTSRSSDKLSGDFFSYFDRSAWRLELLPEYDDAETRERVEAFRRGIVPPASGWYMERVRLARAQGKGIGRVHVIGELTDYLRYELAMYRHNVAAGEDVRILAADAAEGLELPPFDFWLFDDEWIMRMEYGPHGAFRGREAISDARTVARCTRARDAAVQAAQPLQAYLDREAAA
jgi:hypothetical protein